MEGIHLDTTGEPWVGTFDGLGRVLVHADGSIDTEPAPDAATGADDALRFGWGVPVSHLRRGRRLVMGGGLVDTDDRCLVLHGPPAEAERVVVALIGLGWRVLSGRVQAVEVTADGVIAHPDDGSVLVHSRRAERAGLPARPVRDDSDVVAIEAERVETAQLVAGFLNVVERRGEAAPFSVLTGHDRFDASTGLLVGDAIVDGIGGDHAAAMTRSLRLTAVPHARLTVARSTDVDLTELLAWWQS